MTDSDGENPIPGDGTVKKMKKKGEKGERKKKKKKKADPQLQSQNATDLQAEADQGDRKLVQTYKKLEDATKEGMASKKLASKKPKEIRNHLKMMAKRIQRRKI